MRGHLFTVAALCAGLTMVPGTASADTLPGTGSLVGYVYVDDMWKVFVPDTSSAVQQAATLACQPTFDGENWDPQFSEFQWIVTQGIWSMRVTAQHAAYVPKYQCGSISVIGAFRLVDHASDDLTRWSYAYGVDVVEGLSDEVFGHVVAQDGVSGVLDVETGAWWGKRDPATGQMVYYPAGCLEDAWLYTMASWHDNVRAHRLTRKVPCAQPPLPAMPGIPV